MKKIALNDVSLNVTYDLETFKYKLIKLKGLNHELELLLKDKVDSENLTINIPTINDILLEKYPFINELNPEIVNKIIDRNKRINDLVDYAIKNRSSAKLVFNPLEEKDKNVIEMARQYLYSLNKLIYKYEITALYSNVTFINHDVNQLFMGTIDILAKSGGKWLIFSLKSSKTSYLKKYFAELYLQKLLVETNTNLKIKSMFILNPRAERYLFEYQDLTKKEKHNLFF